MPIVSAWADGLATGSLFSSVLSFADTVTYAVTPGSVFTAAGTDGADSGWNLKDQVFPDVQKRLGQG
jgi:hypothetical protein